MEYSDQEYHVSHDEMPSLSHKAAHPTEMNLEFCRDIQQPEDNKKRAQLLKRMFAVAGIAACVSVINSGSGFSFAFGFLAKTNITAVPPAPSVTDTSSLPNVSSVTEQSSQNQPEESSQEPTEESSVPENVSAPVLYQMSPYLSSSRQETSPNGIINVYQEYEHNQFSITGNAHGFDPSQFATAEEALNWLKEQGAISAEPTKDPSTVATEMVPSEDAILIGDQDDWDNIYIFQGSVTRRVETNHFTTWNVVMAE